MKRLIKDIANKFGYDILHLPTNSIERQQLDLFKEHEINLIFDIGANVGQYAQKIRRLGYKGKIVSFEPLPDAFQILKNNAANDPHWQVVQTAIGNFNGESKINIAQNSYSSSILDILPVHIESAPESKYIATTKVNVQKLDDIIDLYYTDSSRLFVKIDTQGFEKQVLEGALKSLNKIKGFQMELSLLTLYENETLMQDMIDLLRTYGYKLVIIEGGHRNYNTGEILQVEGYFLK